jgi:hypothetical protein
MFSKEIITIGCRPPYGYIKCDCGCEGWAPKSLATLEAMP